MGDIYCLVCVGDEIESYLCSSDCSSCENHETGKCFKIAAEDADEVERVKDLLRYLREPTTECNQLPKSTAEVLNRPGTASGHNKKGKKNVEVKRMDT